MLKTNKQQQQTNNPNATVALSQGINPIESIGKGWPVLKERSGEGSEGDREEKERGTSSQKQVLPLCGFRGINQTDSNRIQLHSAVKYLVKGILYN